MTAYGATYADEYDELYREKDYEAECDLIEEALRRFGCGSTRSVLDLGCGTGNHSIRLALRGYDVTGVDVSAQMLSVARRKSAKAQVRIEWIEADVRGAGAGRVFDVGLFMFAVLGYMLPNEDVMAALRSARRQIRKDGLLCFDVWYGPSVLHVRPSERARTVSIPGGQLVRIVTSRLDIRRHACEVHYHFWRIVGTRVEAEGEEVHTVRYFFPMELELMLAQSGFSLASLTAFPSVDRPADESTWNVFAVARAI